MVNRVTGIAANFSGILIAVLFAISVIGVAHTGAAEKSSPGSLAFKDHGRLKQAIDIETLSNVVKAETIKVWDANEEDDVTYDAYGVSALLDAVYGPAWKKSEEILFTCADGYKPSIPVSRFATMKAYLAFKRAGRDDFAILNRHEHDKVVQLAPLYLIWADSGSDLEHTKAEADADAAYWPYEVVGLDLETFAAVFPRLAPPEDSSPAAKHGFLAFRKNCLACHTLNGDGGSGGPELNYPVNITEYYKEEWLKKWILDPTSIRFKTGMPGLSPKAPHREEAADEIIAYFKAMTKNKVKPEQKLK
jgi:mono/diheme cytochrome c family protein